MVVLAVDTSQRIRVGLKKDEDVFEISYAGQRKHAEVLPVLIEKLLKENGISAKDLSVVGIGIGPGTLTGLRVGIATIVGIVAPFDVPIAPLNSFEMAAKSLSIDGTVLVSKRARKGYRYCAVYSKKNDSLEVIREPFVFSDEEVQKILSETRPSVVLEEEIFISPKVLVEEAEKMLKEGKLVHYYEIEPLYLQKSIAELNWEKRKGG
ncbi:tRNA (adenosine(37)-N6)-threonylcarbamoyltransferase complex dimerization subunit type 1 TsaB [Thermotoga sp.]|uniref:tRNA (adenosine(37)-N6)-threonylcarbamoyltransferase complex dimerization subunit type 1 TsaB n=1 Tax=Thermotoga sp. TaxID=28240 RepID=UPI0025FF6DA5|nr:tRNA (adenosine(37)-N6)-threonylcarbamoyltransferase complex dimerization subunit type 1 TsaB [Thermotoga sp.]MCD6550971.1 tRNA (adenosine(37)-N6)-threonylcarbamoyltransferase complex dimerization subunit type 1 TsaB [Thermotoga sp.]